MFKSMKLSTKLVGGFVVVAVITLIVGLIGWKGISDVASDLNYINDNRIPSVKALGIINEAESTIQRAERTMLIPELFEKDRDRQLKTIDAAWKDIDKGFKIYEPLPRSKEEAAAWDKYKPAFDTWKKEHNRVIELVKAGKREEALAVSAGSARDARSATEKILDALIEINDKETKETEHHSESAAKTAKIISLVCMIGGSILAVALGFFLSLSITRPVNRVVTNLSEAAEQVSSASGQVSSASQPLAEGSSEQAASIEETSSSLEEMSSMTKQNADNANSGRQAHEGVPTDGRAGPTAP